jgi:hypothetical protein
LSRTETSSSQALNLSVEEVPPTLWSSLPAWLKSSVNCVVDIFGFQQCGRIERSGAGVNDDRKGKDRTTKSPLFFTCMRMVWVSQRHRQLNGDSMDLVSRMQHVAYYTNVLVLHRLAFRKGSGHMPPLRSLAICAGTVVPLETLLAVGCYLRASPGNRDLRIEDSKLL